MLVVDVVQRHHGAAVEQELRGERLESEVFKRHMQRGLVFRREDGGGGEKKADQDRADKSVQCRNGGVGNRHGTGRVSLQCRQRVGVMFHRRRTGGNVCKCDESPWCGVWVDDTKVELLES